MGVGEVAPILSLKGSGIKAGHILYQVAINSCICLCEGTFCGK